MIQELFDWRVSFEDRDAGGVPRQSSTAMFLLDFFALEGAPWNPSPFLFIQFGPKSVILFLIESRISLLLAVFIHLIVNQRFVQN